MEQCCGQPMRLVRKEKQHGYEWHHYQCAKCPRMGCEKGPRLHTGEEMAALRKVMGGHPWATAGK